jgi:ABC-type multidrug transport system ATPase subunit
VSKQLAEHNPAYVQQEDLLFAQLSVRETLETDTTLQMHADHHLWERRKTVSKLIKDLGLKKARIFAFVRTLACSYIIFAAKSCALHGAHALSDRFML